MADFQSSTAAETLGALASLSGSRLDKEVKRLLYKKATRPTGRDQQFDLFHALSQDTRLGEFERAYALIAASHKASEQCKVDDVAALMPALMDRHHWAHDLPPSKQLRKDGMHLRFSILNVLMNGGVLLRSPDCAQTAALILTELARINPRHSTHYTFNSTTNILNTVGVALLFQRGQITGTLPLLSALIYHAMRMKFTRRALAAKLHLGVPSTLAQVEPPSNFFKFEESFRKFLIIKSAAGAPQGLSDPEHFWALASECVSQWTSAQKAALLDALSDLCPDVAKTAV